MQYVLNPEGAFLPPSQAKLEEVFHEKLFEDHSVLFNNLITITNMPIGRFLNQLKKNNEFEDYMRLLKNSYNPLTLKNLMCRQQLSIAWDGTFHDCDFNLALGIPIERAHNVNDQSLDLSKLKERRILSGYHCFACTAGQGSSCSGALV